MKRVIGIGGIFFKSQDPEKLVAWYREHLGMDPSWEGGVTFQWRDAQRPGRAGQPIWSPFPADTDYFEPCKEPYLINYIVEDLEALLAQLCFFSSRRRHTRLQGDWSSDVCSSD